MAARHILNQEAWGAVEKLEAELAELPGVEEETITAIAERAGNRFGWPATAPEGPRRDRNHPVFHRVPAPRGGAPQRPGAAHLGAGGQDHREGRQVSSYPLAAGAP